MVCSLIDAITCADLRQPPRRQAKPAAAPAPRRSKLAKENNVSVETEAEIRSAWEAFRHLHVPNYEKEKEGVMRTEDLKKAFVAQNLKLSQSDMKDALEILDAESDGIVTFEHFFEVSALHQNQREEDGDGDSEDDEGAVHEAEVVQAMRLFTNGQNRPITLNDLRQVARTLKEDVDESILRAMILEANGNKGVSAGVNKEDFADLGARAGAFR